jgi:hypothetical protein
VMVVVSVSTQPARPARTRTKGASFGSIIL